MADDVSVMDASLESGVTDETSFESQVTSDLDILNEADAPAEPQADDAAPPQADAAPAQPAAQQPAAPQPPAQPAAAELPPSIKAIADKIASNPAIKAALDQDPQLRNTIFANARRSEELTEFKEIFRTKELATMARQSAEDFNEIENLYMGAGDQFAPNEQTFKNFDSLLERMYMSQVQRDPATGNPMVDQATGQYVSKGFLEGFLTHHRAKYFWPQVEELARANGAEEVLDATSKLREFLGEGGMQNQPQQPVRQDLSNLPADVRQKLAKLDALERQQGQQSTEAVRQYEQGVVTSVTDGVKTLLTERVERLSPALSAPIKKRIIDDAFSEISKLAAQDKLYQSNWQRTFRSSARSDETKGNLVNQAVSYSKGVLGPIVQKLIREFSSEAIQANTQKVAKLNTQQQRAEVRSTGGVTPPRQGDVHSTIREAEKLSRQLNGRGLTDNEILDVEEVLENLQRRVSAR